MSDAYTFPRERRHTLFFLEQATAYRPVYLDTEIDMSQVIAHRKVCSVKRSYIAYVIQAVGRVVARFPEANAMITGRLFPRLSRLPGVDAKFTLDDAAAFRQPDLAAVAAVENPTDLERRGAEVGLKFIQLDGNVGVLANGAGLTMTTMDVISHFGGRPANFMEIGGEALTLTLNTPSTAALISGLVASSGTRKVTWLCSDPMVDFSVTTGARMMSYIRPWLSFTG